MKELIGKAYVRDIVEKEFLAHDGKELSVEMLTDVISASISTAINGININELASSIRKVPPPPGLNMRL